MKTGKLYIDFKNIPLVEGSPAEIGTDEILNDVKRASGKEIILLNVQDNDAGVTYPYLAVTSIYINDTSFSCGVKYVDETGVVSSNNAIVVTTNEGKAYAVLVAQQ